MGEVADGGLVGPVGSAQCCGGGGAELGEAGLKDPAVDAGEEHGVAQAGVGDLVAVGAGDTLDQAVLAESAPAGGGRGTQRAVPAGRG